MPAGDLIQPSSWEDDANMAGVILGIYWENGEENGNYYNGVM